MVKKDDGTQATPGGRFQVTDKRFWASNEKAVEEAEPAERQFPSFVEELKARTELAESRLREKIEQLDRDNESLRERLRREMQQQLEREKLDLIKTFLEVVDNFERALEAAPGADEAVTALRQGVELTLRLFCQKLEALGLEVINPLGEEFDPELAQAVAMIPVDEPDQDHRVVEVLLKGYRKDDHLIRPAQVRVGQYSPS